MTQESPTPAENSRKRSGYGRAWQRSTATMLVVIAFVAGIGFDRLVLVGTTAWSAQRITDLEDLDEFTVLQETYELIRQYYVLSDDIPDEELIWGAARGMVDALGDEGHSVFRDPAEAEQYRQSRSGSYVGIGITVDVTVNPPLVIMPYQNSPAFEAGIQQGDAILAVDGAPASEFANMETFTDLIGGEEGTDVEIELRHEGEVESYTVTITRARIDLDPVSWAMLPDGILWVRIQAFQEGASEGLKQALEAGIDQGASGVILDLRANPGGLETELIAVASQFSPDGTVLYQNQDADGNVEETTVRGDNGLWLDGPLVILIDENSASASEVVSSGAQDNERATLIGQTTFGTGTVVRAHDISDGSIVSIGFELWLTPDGHVIWHRGVSPDIAVAMEPGTQISLPYMFENNVVTQDQMASAQDSQLLAAIDDITSQIAGEG
ncbi:MAG TPA: S41 family peptidase [Thermomicrobiales bacterium]|nr:S41 family peptidase [Thermomicrobiales bacterium]